MKKIIGPALVALIIIIACSKSSNTGEISPTNNNEIKATGLLSTGERIEIHLKGADAKMGIENPNLFDFTTFIWGGSMDSTHIIISVYPTVQSVGTYTDSTFSLNFYRNRTVLYSNYYDGNTGFIRNTGGITFTTYKDNYWEGTFNAICRRYAVNNDSMVVSGTFRGNTIIR